VIPIADSAYAAGRGALAYTPDATLQLDATQGLNAAMPGLKKLWDAKQVAIVQGVGYPNPDRSHFRSMDIWQSGVSERFEGTGWLGRWNDRAGADPLQMVSLGASVPRVMLGARSSAAAIPGGKLDLPGGSGLASAYARMVAADAATTLGPWGGAIADAGADLLRAQATYQPLLASSSESTVSTSLEGGAVVEGQAGAGSAFARQLTLVASLIRGGAPARAYSVSLGGFDTHAEEKTGHERLLAHPSLTALDDGDLRYTTDFRSVYATVLGSTLGLDPKDVLGTVNGGRTFAPVPFL